MGADHNRWHVAQVFGRILGGLRTQDATRSAADSIRLVRRSDLAWCVENLGFEVAELPGPIKANIKSKLNEPETP
jgi:hypothetical protein